jgi:hypothetical protein
MLGFTERVTRRLIDMLVGEGLLERRGLKTCITDNGRSILAGLNIQRCYSENRHIAGYSGLDECLESVINRISMVRDNIVILTGDPHVFEVIGVKKNGDIVVPGVPNSIAGYYGGLVRRCGLNRGVFIVWGNYHEYLYDAYALYSILETCNSVNRLS